MIELAEYDLADAPLIASCKVKAASRLITWRKSIMWSSISIP